MKLYRCERGGEIFWAREEAGGLRRLDAGAAADLASASPLGEPIPLASVRILAPVVAGKIVAVGRNYADHAKELGNEPPSEPVLFLKPPSSLLDPGGTIELPAASSRVDYEAELAIVIGRRARRVAAASWRDYVLGFTCANDVTARDLQKRDVQFTRGKSFDTFCPIGPFIETEIDVTDLALVARLNGEVRQDARTSQMIFPPPFLLEFISGIMTLEPGDVILTGTPAGVGPMAEGDRIEIEIEGIGVLANRVGRPEA